MPDVQSKFASGSPITMHSADRKINMVWSTFRTSNSIIRNMICCRDIIEPKLTTEAERSEYGGLRWWAPEPPKVEAQPVEEEK